MAKRNYKRDDKPILGGAGGGYDLPSIDKQLASKTGCGTYRGKDNSISTVGLDLPVPKENNPHGTGPKYKPAETHQQANGPSNVDFGVNEFLSASSPQSKYHDETSSDYEGEFNGATSWGPSAQGELHYGWFGLSWRPNTLNP
ncbi:hypothetical protein PG985_005341 [Apiospora marii]|uniref:Uncharacterized protein n=1 Tax=Apiospora marii TaxID=335849 RepID=A0ABR1SCZ5_9PEZI